MGCLHPVARMISDDVGFNTYTKLRVEGLKNTSSIDLAS
jgi:hypothetical protein